LRAGLPQIDRENIRNRREHEIEYIRRRIGMLDYVLSHPQWKYLETEPEKLSYFCNQLKVPNHFLPRRSITAGNFPAHRSLLRR